MISNRAHDDQRVSNLFCLRDNLAARGSWPQNPIEAIREVGRIGINQFKLIRGCRVCADWSPVCKIGGGFQHIRLARYARELQLECVVGGKAFRTKKYGRIYDEQ